MYIFMCRKKATYATATLQRGHQAAKMGAFHHASKPISERMLKQVAKHIPTQSLQSQKSSVRCAPNLVAFSSDIQLKVYSI